MNAYKTLLRAASDEIVMQKSRFIGHGAPAATEEEALEFLRQKRMEYKDASHN
jgi:putative IMPACT (imprinted ancient) family translation regulator